MSQSAVREGAQAVWVPPGQLVMLDGRELTYGNFYFGNHLGAVWSEANDNGVVNPRLLNGGGAVLPYNSHEPPSYRTLTPRHRRDYIEWLSTGCLDPFVPEEFASIYFYGLEHRLMIEMKGNEPKVIGEIRRLGALFPSAARLQRDVARLELFLGRKVAYAARPVFTKEMLTAHRPAPSVLLYLGKKIANGGVIDGKDALLWVQSCFKIFMPKAYVRCRAEFEALFEKRFDEKYPAGLAVSSRKPLRLFYRTATWHRSVDFVLPADVANVPDVEQAAGLVEQLSYLVSRVGADLESYDRLLSRKPAAARTVEAVVALPKPLHTSEWIGRFAEVRQLIDQNLAKSGFISTSVPALLDMLGLQRSQKNALTARAAAEISQLFDVFDVGYEPDRRYGYTALQMDGSVCLFKAEEGGPVEPEEVAFKGVRLVTELVVRAAAVDGTVNQREMQVLKSFLEASAFLTAVQKQRLTAIARALMKTAASAAPVFSGLSRMSNDLQMRALDVVVDVVLADGMANPQEVSFLEKLYKALGEPVSDLHMRLHRQGDGLASVEAASPAAGVAIRRPQPNAQGRPEESEPVRVTDVVIDFERFSRIKAETASVSAILSEIFKEEEQPVALSADNSDATSVPFAGLDAAHGELLARLTVCDLTRSDFETSCRELGLMPDAALETLSEWGFDNIGEAIMEEGLKVAISRDFLDDVKALRKNG